MTDIIESLRARAEKAEAERDEAQRDLALAREVGTEYRRERDAAQESSDYFKDSYSRKLADEAKALESAQAVCAQRDAAVKALRVACAAGRQSESAIAAAQKRIETLEAQLAARQA